VCAPQEAHTEVHDSITTVAADYYHGGSALFTASAGTLVRIIVRLYLPYLVIVK
jgi:hypothetical protein